MRFAFYTLEQNNMKEEKAFEVPEQGSLGLLALGYVGLVAWRNKRKEVKQKKAKGKNEG